MTSSQSESSRKRWQFTVLASMYLGYAAFMLCRNTLISTSATMVADPTLGLDTEGYGRLMAWHSAGAIVGKLVTGIGADIIGGRRMFLLALALTAAANVAMGMASSLFLFGFLNFFGQFFKAGGWPAMAKLIGSWYPKKSHGRVWSIISTSSRVGTIAAVLILGFLLSLVSWRTVFMISAALTGVIVVIGYFTLKERPEAVGLAPIEDEPAVDTPIKKVAHPFDHLTRGKACLAFATSARFWLICLSLAFLCIMMDFLNFIPLFLVQTLGAEPSDASMAGSAFPAGMFLALIATAIFYDRLTKKQLVYVLGGLLGISCLCVLLLWNLGNLPLPAGSGLYVAMAAIFLFGFSISPAYYIPMSVFSIAFGGRHSGFLIALIDVSGYSGALVFNFFGGTIAQKYGWSVFLAILLIVTVLALFNMIGFLALDYRANRLEK